MGGDGWRGEILLEIELPGNAVFGALGCPTEWEWRDRVEAVGCQGTGRPLDTQPLPRMPKSRRRTRAEVGRAVNWGMGFSVPVGGGPGDDCREGGATLETTEELAGG